MPTTARHDPIVHRFVPDPDIVARAQRDMMDAEEEASDSVRFVRQRWEEAFAATRVAVAALREIYPSERHHVDPETSCNLDVALDSLTGAYAALDDCSAELLGGLMHSVLLGHVTTHAGLDELGVERYADQT